MAMPRVEEPIEGNLSEIKVARAHYFKWKFLIQNFFDHKVDPEKVPTKNVFWLNLWIVQLPLTFRLREIKYHNILETDSEKKLLISWDLQPPQGTGDTKPNIHDVSEIIENKRVRIGAHWTVEHGGMAKNLGLPTSNLEHYPDINTIEEI